VQVSLLPNTVLLMTFFPPQGEEGVGARFNTPTHTHKKKVWNKISAELRGMMPAWYFWILVRISSCPSPGSYGPHKEVDCHKMFPSKEGCFQTQPSNSKPWNTRAGLFKCSLFVRDQSVGLVNSNLFVPWVAGALFLLLCLSEQKPVVQSYLKGCFLELCLAFKE